MSYIAAGTQNNIGMRNPRTRITLGVQRAPAEMTPIQQLFGTHPLAGLGAAAQSANGGSPATRMPSHVMRSPSPTIIEITAQPYGAPNIASAPAAAVLPPTQPSGPVATATSPTSVIQAPAPAPVMPALTSGAASTAQAGTPVPVGYPTTQAYIDSSGNIWTYTPAGGWQVTGTTATTTATAAEAAAQASEAAGGVSISTTTADWAASITTWLQSASIISGVPNFWLVAGVGVAGLLLWPRGKR